MASVVVTGGELAPAAVALLHSRAVALTYSPAYPEPAALAALVAAVAADALILRTGRATAAVIAASPRLRLIAKHGTGVDTIDLAAAAARGIAVVSAAGTNAQSAAEHTLALMLALTKRLVPLDARVKGGAWPKPGHLGMELAGKRLGLIGCGAIGRRVAGFGAALGLAVGYIRRSPAPLADLPFARWCPSLAALLEDSDIVSLHCPLTAETRGMLDGAALARMQPTAFLINTARGGLVDEPALLAALASRRLAGAAFDCLAQEPPPPDHPFFGRPDVLLSPHVAGSTAEAKERMGLAVARQVVAALEGAPLDPALVVRAPA